MSTAVQSVTADTFARIFDKARQKEYPAIDKIEHTYDHKLARTKLEDAARILACPVKKNPPHWQHGRVIYAVTMAYLKGKRDVFNLLDLGTAKGFSALCLQWALDDSNLRDYGSVVSLDILDPNGTEKRNSVLELDGPKTLRQFLEPWKDAADRITFHKSTGIAWLQRHHARTHVAFIDGSHEGNVVYKEGELIAKNQQTGDIIICDDVQRDNIRLSVQELERYYWMEIVRCCEYRTYAIGVRR
jgi:predicted O-methyltransferase YrrM